MNNKFSLSLDDFSAHPRAGLNFESIYWCDKLIERFPDVRINLFVPAAYARLNEQKHHLTNFPEWVQRVKELSSKNYRICPHGLFHRRFITDFEFHKKSASNNDEFQFLDTEQAKTIIYKMLAEFENAGLKYSKVFRPPGWKISLSSAKVLTSMGFIIAGDDKYYKLLKNLVINLKWVSVNWHLTPETNIIGDLICAGHTSNWTHNFFNEASYDLVCKVLDSKQYEFKFLEEMV
ncbi:hypothetical protein LCGC14_1948650 [marine sediment metagenome]|uniref:NodB homology domain-containing protein n=1 Tax=marine sediment metagenome TaxID=412755 RepID=A0A0F9FI12_9ZZZZ